MTRFQGMRSGGRVVEGARLESEYTSKAYRGFESLPLRHLILIFMIKIKICAVTHNSAHDSAAVANELPRTAAIMWSRNVCSQALLASKKAGGRLSDNCKAFPSSFLNACDPDGGPLLAVRQ